MIVDRNPPMLDLPLTLEAYDLLVGRLPFRIVQPRIVPDVQLLQRHSLDAQVLE